jgi:autotransporter-associated beta strand protein
MMNTASKLTFLSAFLGAAASLSAQVTGFNGTGAGPYDYNNVANWVDETINGIWDSTLTLTANQTVFFEEDTSLATGLEFRYLGARTLTLRGEGGDRTIALGGDLLVSPSSNQTVTIGSLLADQGLHVNLNGDRTATVAVSKMLQFYNTLSGGTLTVSGTTGGRAGAGGVVSLSGDSATSSGTLNVVKGASLLFDSGADGSAGATRAQSLGLSGGSLLLAGNNGSDTTETITEALSIAPGQANNTVTLTPGTESHLSFNAGSLVRSGVGTVLFRGTNLGVNPVGDSVAGSSNIIFGTAPALVGGELGTRSAGIIPWAIIDTSATGVGSSFATYDAVHGLRALTEDEYSTTIATDGSTSGHNIKLSGGATLTVNGATSVNSLFVSSGASASTTLAGTDYLTITSGAAFFDLTPIAGNNRAMTIAKPLNFGATQGILGTTGNSGAQRQVRITGDISGSGGLVFYDTGTNLSQASGFYLANAYSYSGDTHINGQVTVGANNALPNFTNGGRTGDVYVNGALKLSAQNTSITINGLWGNGVIGSEYTNSNKTLVVGDNNATSTFDGYIYGENGWVSLAKMGSGTLTLTSTLSSYTGSTSVRNGTLSVVTLNSVDLDNQQASSSLGRPTSVAFGTIGLGLQDNTGILRVTGSGETTDRVINLAGSSGGGEIEQAGTGLLKFTSDFTATGGGDKTLTLSGSTSGIGEIAGAIVNNSVSNETAVAKDGSGTWILSGHNTYTGGTTVSEGTLLINGSLAAAGNVNVNGGTLGGAGDGEIAGIIGGNTTLAAGAKLSPGAEAGLAGNLTFSNGLNLSASSNDTGAYLFNLNAVGNSDRITLTSGTAFALNVGTLDAADFTFTIGAGFGAGTYVLFDANSAIAGSIGDGFVDFGDGITGTLSIDNITNDVLLTVVPEPSAAVLVALGLAGVCARRRRK